MNITAIEGRELAVVAFAADFVRLNFGDEGPVLTFHAHPQLLLPDFSIAFGEPEYRNALCAQIGDTVAHARYTEHDSLSLEFDSGTVIALSLREEDLDGPTAGTYAHDGTSSAEEEF